ncbi:MAG TPA: hypothetical protein VIL28_02345, partial [Steroidobacteraceae bacterium]
PYAPPEARVADVAAPTSAEEEIRRAHVKHEASVRAVGLLYIFGSVLLVFSGLVLLAMGPSALMPETGELPPGFGYFFADFIGAIYIGLGVFSFIVGRAVRRFRPWARIAGIVLSVLGLAGFPIGTIINAYFLYLFASAKGRRIFEPDYPAIVAATPHIKYRTSIIVWILLAILILAILAAIFVPMVGG